MGGIGYDVGTSHGNADFVLKAQRRASFTQSNIAFVMRPSSNPLAVRSSTILDGRTAFKGLSMWWNKRNLPPRRNTPGHVYIMAGDNGLYKLGSSKNPKERKTQITRNSGVKSDLIFSVETSNMHSLERFLHKTFMDKRVYNEWFDLSNDELERAKEIMRGSI